MFMNETAQAIVDSEQLVICKKAMQELRLRKLLKLLEHQNDSLLLFRKQRILLRKAFEACPILFFVKLAQLATNSLNQISLNLKNILQLARTKPDFSL